MIGFLDARLVANGGIKLRLMKLNASICMGVSKASGMLGFLKNAQTAGRRCADECSGVCWSRMCVSMNEKLFFVVQSRRVNIIWESMATIATIEIGFLVKSDGTVRMQPISLRTHFLSRHISVKPQPCKDKLKFS